MNINSYVDKMRTVSRQAGNIANKAIIEQINIDANLLAIDCLRLLLTEAESILKSARESNHADAPVLQTQCSRLVPTGNDLQNAESAAGADAVKPDSFPADEAGRKSCMTCRYRDFNLKQYPCDKCFFKLPHYSLWEAQDEATPPAAG